MIYTMNAKNTGLRESYLVETQSTVSGCIATFYTMDKNCLGQFTNNRQNERDSRSLENVVKYDPRMNEILEYFERKRV